MTQARSIYATLIYALIFASGLLTAVATHAQAPAADPFQLIEQGKLKQAKKLVGKQLRTTPGDPQLLFAEALIADKIGQSEKAVKLYVNLIKSHPTLIGPYNNLAIHYANAGEYQAAVQTLDSALEANQSVATTYQNLKSIYATMASAAYRKALDSDSPSAPLQLTAIEKVDRIEIQSGQPALVASAESYIAQSLGQTESATTAAAQTPAQSQSAAKTDASVGESGNIVIAAANAQVTNTGNNETTASKKPVVEVAKVNVTATTDSQSATASRSESSSQTAAVVKPVQPSEQDKLLAERSAAEKQALINHVKSWASAWSDRDVDRYLSHYSDRFKPRNDLSLDDWKKQRYGRLRWREFIIVKPSKYNIDLDNDVATVNFNQYYKSERFEDTIRKTLKFRKENGKWRITRELI